MSDPSRPLGVGFLGAGPVTQAIHLPVLASLGARFRPVHVMDVDLALATAVAEGAGANSTDSVSAVLDDPEVDVVAICSPHQFHAEQVIAACAAGKRAVLCEKPLATTSGEAQQMIAAVRSSQTELIVGTMHAYDPALAAARNAWRDTGDTARWVRSTIYLPSNDTMVDLATEAQPSAAIPAQAARPPSDSERAAALLRGAVLGLAIHNLPLIRSFVDFVPEVLAARTLNPFGYAVTMRSPDGGFVAELTGLLPGQWAPHWALTVIGADHELEVQFPPSYVLAGSATATMNSPGERRTWRYDYSGYQAEWQRLHDLVASAATCTADLDGFGKDLDFALGIAEDAARVLQETA